MKLTVGGELYEVEYVEHLWEANGVFTAEVPKFITFDTETTGLHLKKDTPFLGAVCFNNWVFVFPATEGNMKQIVVWSKHVKRVYAHNTTFDMHMMANEGVDPLQIKNWGDTMCLARLSFEAKSTRHGGDSLKLKAIGKKYIDRNADVYEKAVKKWLQDKRKQDKKILTALLKPFGWSATKLEDATEIPKEVMDVYTEWNKHYPAPTYQDVPMDIMLPYVAVDVILTKILVMKALPVVVQRKQVPVMEREFKVLPIVWKMERVGIKVDRGYLMDCNRKLASYIDHLYQQLHAETGMEFTVGQHKFIKEMYASLLGEEPKSTDKKFLKAMADKGDKVATIISRLRRLEKWKETYIERILQVSEHDGRFYTSMNQFNPVTGRFSGDLQQMPKDPILDENEQVIYHPRRAFIVDGNGWNSLYFMDFSQVELRLQSHYTLMFGGDINLCRAYMPFQCRHYKTGEIFDYEVEENRLKWEELKEGFDPVEFTKQFGKSDWEMEHVFKAGWSAWLTEDGTPWVPTDVHMATTLKALVAMGYNPEEMDAKDIKWWRNKGKTFNFMRNYGGGDQMAADTLDIPLEAAKALNKGYTDAFPLVVTYQNAVIRTVREKGYVENLYGRRYYLSDWNKAYACGNYLMQGSGADDLKEKMIKIDAFLQENNLKTRMILCIHDELIFSSYEGEEWAIWEIKRIMEDTPTVVVPIVAEVKVAKETWSSKSLASRAGERKVAGVVS